MSRQGTGEGLVEVEETEDPGKLHRIASGIPVIPAFDGYRAFAILGLVFLHVLQSAGVTWTRDDGGLAAVIWALDPGQTCVEILFMVSGFVVFLPTVTKQGNFGDLKAFAARRVGRLVPAYWFVLTLMLFLILVVNTTPEIPFPSTSEIITTYLTLEVPADLVNHVYTLGFGINRAIWTLSPELIFYLLLPLVAPFFFRRPVVWLVVALLVTAGWKFAFSHWAGVSSAFGDQATTETVAQMRVAAEIQFPYWAFSFALGMGAAWTYVKLRASRSAGQILGLGGRAQTVALIAIALTVAIALAWGPEVPRDSVPLGALYSMVLALFLISTAISTRPRQLLFSNRIATWLADVSYGTYLIHLVIVTYVGLLVEPPRSGSAGDVLQWFIWVLPASVIFGYLSARFLERPIRRRAQRYAASREAPPAAGTSRRS